MATAPGHPGGADWGASRPGEQAARLLRVCQPFTLHQICVYLLLQAGESHFEGSATAAFFGTSFGTSFAKSTRVPAPMLEGQAVFGQGYPRCRQGLRGTTQPQDWRPGSRCLCRPGCTARQVNQRRRDAQSRGS